MSGKVISINISAKKGERKSPVGQAQVRADYGLEGDAHSSSQWHRQVSLLAMESIERMREAGVDVGPGDFAENITTSGIDLLGLPLETRLAIGPEVQGEVSQIGKKCHDKGCAIMRKAGKCVMPKEGIFIRVLKGGTIREGDEVRLLQ